MAFTGINVDEKVKYISKHDPDKENPTVFLIGALDPYVKAKIEDDATDFEFSGGGDKARSKQTLKVGSSIIELVRWGLRGIENFIHPVTKEQVQWRADTVNFKKRSYEVASEEIMRLLPPVVIKELAEKISSINRLSEEEEKN